MSTKQENVTKPSHRPSTATTTGKLFGKTVFESRPEQPLTQRDDLRRGAVGRGDAGGDTGSSSSVGYPYGSKRHRTSGPDEVVNPPSKKQRHNQPAVVKTHTTLSDLSSGGGREEYETDSFSSVANVAEEGRVTNDDNDTGDERSSTLSSISKVSSTLSSSTTGAKKGGNSIASRRPQKRWIDDEAVVSGEEEDEEEEEDDDSDDNELDIDENSGMGRSNTRPLREAEDGEEEGDDMEQDQEHQKRGHGKKHREDQYGGSEEGEEDEDNEDDVDDMRNYREKLSRLNWSHCMKSLLEIYNEEKQKNCYHPEAHREHSEIRSRTGLDFSGKFLAHLGMAFDKTLKCWTRYQDHRAATPMLDPEEDEDHEGNHHHQADGVSRGAREDSRKWRDRFYDAFGVDRNARYTIQELERNYNIAILWVLRLQQILNEFDWQAGDSMSFKRSEYERSLNRALFVIYYAKRGIESEIQSEGFADPTRETEIPDGVFSRTPDDEEKSKSGTPFQQFMAYVLSFCEEMRYRKYQENVYQQIVTREGYNTHSWEVVCSIEEMVWNCVDRKSDYHQWLNFTSKGNIPHQTIEHLTKKDYPELPTLTPCRSSFSFRNGIYLAKENRFIPYGSDEMVDNTVTTVSFSNKVFDPNYIQRGDGDENEENDEDVVEEEEEEEEEDGATDTKNKKTKGKRGHRRRHRQRKAKKTPWQTIPEGSWDQIPTPVFDSIFDYQLDSETAEERHQIKFWNMAMLGRLFYALGELDEWSMIMFYKGVPGSGKSTTAKLMASIYPPSMVHTLSANMEVQFGLSAIYNKLLYVCYEVKKRGWKLSTADMQSMISGENISVAIKNKVARDIRWNVPGILCGNEYGPWGIAMQRRVLLLEFCRPVQAIDTTLYDKMKKELPAIIAKVNQCYLFAVQKYQGCGLSPGRELPVYFKKTLANMKKDSCSLYAFFDDDSKFLRSQEEYEIQLAEGQREGQDRTYDYMMFGADRYYDYSDFNRIYMDWCKQNGFYCTPLASPACMDILKQKGITMTTSDMRWKGKKCRSSFLAGVGIPINY